MPEVKVESMKCCSRLRLGVSGAFSNARTLAQPDTVLQVATRSQTCIFYATLVRLNTVLRATMRALLIERSPYRNVQTVRPSTQGGIPADQLTFTVYVYV